MVLLQIIFTGLVKSSPQGKFSFNNRNCSVNLFDMLMIGISLTRSYLPILVLHGKPTIIGELILLPCLNIPEDDSTEEPGGIISNS